MGTTKPSVSVKSSYELPEKLRAGPWSHGQKQKGPGLWVVLFSPVEWPSHSSLTHLGCLGHHYTCPFRVLGPTGSGSPGGGCRVGDSQSFVLPEAL